MAAVDARAPTSFDLPQNAGCFRGYGVVIMPRLPAKALLTLLTMNRSRREQPNWDRIVIVSSTVVTVGLVALFACGKATSRW
jgi:hypothetical protein